MPTINIAVTGCGHGELDIFYKMCDTFNAFGKKIELLIITGDFQAMRNQEDLGCMKCPVKYMFMRDFYKYYNGEKKAPVLTIFIGGNHEATNYQRELHFGGWVAPNIYYMGASNVIHYKGLTIGGISGIFKSQDYERGYYETFPFDSSSFSQGGDFSKASAFHYRHLDILKLLSYSSPIDIMVSHDWPSRVFQYGDVPLLLRRKPFFQDDVNAMCLGSPPLMDILNGLKPKFWFASHLHVKFAAVVPHNNTCSPINVLSPSESDLSPVDTSILQPKNNYDNSTRFLALDKCVKGRDFIQVIDIDVTDEWNGDEKLYYDAEWLEIVKQSYSYVSTSSNRVILPSKLVISDEVKNYIESIFNYQQCDITHGMPISQNFQRIAPVYDGLPTDGYNNTIAISRGNNQTDDYLTMLGLQHVITKKAESDAEVTADQIAREDPNAIDLDDIFCMC